MTKSDEITGLLTKLYTLQEEVGAKEKSSEEEKKAKAAGVTMGKTKKAQKSGSRFLELKSTIVERLKKTQGMLSEEKEKAMNAGFGSGNDPKQSIKAQAQIREEIRQAQEEWKEMNAIYKNEARKKRSKFSPEELEVQHTLLMKLYRQIEKLKKAQTKGFSNVGGATETAASLNGMTIGSYDSSAYGSNSGGGGWTAGTGGPQLTEQQKMQIQQLEERDQDFDNQLDEMGEGIQDLAEIAQMQGEEVKKQNAMLTQLDQKMDKAQEHLTSVNSKMKETLEEVGRSGDKIIVDIICIVLAIGFASVIYNMAQ